MKMIIKKIKKKLEKGKTNSFDCLDFQKNLNLNKYKKNLIKKLK